MAAPFHLYTVGYGAAQRDVAAGLAGWADMWRMTGAHDGLTLYLGFHLARGAAFVGHADLIAETEPALQPYAHRFAFDGTGSVCHGPISAALAALAAARGDTALAERYYRQAIAACRRIGAPLLQALFERELAELGQRASPDEPDERRTSRTPFGAARCVATATCGSSGSRAGRHGSDIPRASPTSPRSSPGPTTTSMCSTWSPPPERTGPTAVA